MVQSKEFVAADIESLTRQQIAQQFQIIQDLTQVASRKHLNTLYKLQQELAAISEETKGGLRLTGERIFNTTLTNVVLFKILAAPKGQQWADRAGRFIASFVSHCLKKDHESSTISRQDVLEGSVEDSTATRLTSALFKILIKGLSSADKTVRFRSTQLVAAFLGSPLPMDLALYQDLKECLLARLEDREIGIRQQSVLALSRLSSDTDTEIEKALLNAIKFDRSSDVRRAGILHCRISPDSIVAFVERSKDSEALNRKAIFARLAVKEAASNSSQIESAFDAFWQHHLSLLNSLLGAGLQDKDEGVRTAAQKFTVGVVSSSTETVGAFLQILGYISREDEHTAESFFQACISVDQSLIQALHEQVSAQDWSQVTLREAICARLLFAHYRVAKNYDSLEAVLPVLTAHSFRIEAMTIAPPSAARSLSASHGESGAVLQEMLRMTLEMDFTDELGRRKIFETTRKILRSVKLPLSIITPATEIIKKINPVDEDFSRTLFEIINEIADSGDSTSTDADHEAGFTLADCQLRCLQILVSLLERIEKRIEPSSPIFGLLASIVIPCIKTKLPEMRQEGIHALGLACLLDAGLASQNLGLLMNQSQTAHQSLRCLSLKLMIDQMTQHGTQAFFAGSEADTQIKEYLLHVMANENHELQCISATGLSKLVLSGQLSDTNFEILLPVMVRYFSTDDEDDDCLKQCLRYFISAYSYSSLSNQVQVQCNVSRIFQNLHTSKTTLTGDSSSHDDSDNVLRHILMWTDVQKLEEATGITTNDLGQTRLLQELLKSLLHHTCESFHRSIASALPRLLICGPVSQICKDVLETSLSEVRSCPASRGVVSVACLNDVQANVKNLEVATQQIDYDAYWDTQHQSLDSYITAARQTYRRQHLKEPDSRKIRQSAGRKAGSRALRREVDSLQDHVNSAEPLVSRESTPPIEPGSCRRKTPARKATLKVASGRATFGGFSDSDESEQENDSDRSAITFESSDAETDSD